MKKILGFVAVTVAGLSFLPVAHGITISMSVPGSSANGSTTNPGGFISNFYQFALMIGGVLAFAVVIYGGVKYMTSSGNPSGQSDAKEWIEAALLGILLLLAAYFILSIVNPQLLNLNLPGTGGSNTTLPPVNTQPAAK